MKYFEILFDKFLEADWEERAMTFLFTFIAIAALTFASFMVGVLFTDGEQECSYVKIGERSEITVRARVQYRTDIILAEFEDQKEALTYARANTILCEAYTTDGE